MSIYIAKYSDILIANFIYPTRQNNNQARQQLAQQVILQKISERRNNMRIDKTNTNFVRVEMTLEEYKAFEQLLQLQRKDYKGG